MADGYAIRPATQADLPALQQVEHRAATRFMLIGMAGAAQGPLTMNEPSFSLFLSQGALYALTDASDAIVGLAAGCILDGAGHLAELDVLPEHAGKRLGARLIEAVADWARTRGAVRLTLVTYRDVPWNAPYYARLGFLPFDLSALGPDHLAIWRSQAGSGLDMTQRLIMARSLG